jgi:hypothetical protein
MPGFDALGKQALGQFTTASSFATILEDSWHQPFNTDIVRKLRPMHTGAQQFASYVEFAPFPETVSADRWFVPFSEPTRYKQTRVALHTGAQQFASFVQFAPFAETVSADRWFVPFSEPTRFLKALPTAQQQFSALVEFAPFAESVSADRWFVPFSEPVRFKPRMTTAHQWFGRGIEFPLTSSVVNTAVNLLCIASFSGVPTSNYKQILTETKRKIFYAAEISPWTLSQ